VSGPLRKVIILGAGASVPAGAPTMMNFLDQARYLRRHGLSDEDIPAFDAVLDSLRDLSGIYEKAYLDLNNLEEVFGAIEMAQLISKLADRRPAEIEQLRQHFITLVVRTLQLSITVEAAGAPPAAAGKLAAGISAAIDRGVDVSILTFNYDLVMEMALQTERLGYAYGLAGEQPRPHKRVIPLLKLHGSVNWNWCDQCKMVYDARTFRHSYSRFEQRFVAASHPAEVHASCSYVPSPTPVIVPPSWDKSRYQGSLRAVWEQAATALGAADEIFVIGYSLPEADSFFRYLFALGTQSRTRVHRMLVVNPDNTVRPKFERFIGQGLRAQLKFLDNGYFQSAVGEVNAMLAQT
jgi:hypothetical protein